MKPLALIRLTIVAVARELHQPRIEVVSTINAATVRFSHHRCDGLVLDEQAASHAPMQRLRAGQFVTPADSPVIETAESCNADTAALMNQHGVSRRPMTR